MVVAPSSRVDMMVGREGTVSRLVTTTGLTEAEVAVVVVVPLLLLPSLPTLPTAAPVVSAPILLLLPAPAVPLPAVPLPAALPAVVEA